MRLLRDIPEIEERIESGALTLSNLNLAQTLFKREKQEGNPVTKESKMEVLFQLENKSKREAQAIVAEINPGLKSTRKLDFDIIEDESLRDKLLSVKGLFAAVDPNMSLEEVLHRLCDQELAKRSNEPSRSVRQKIVRQLLRADDAAVPAPARVDVNGGPRVSKAGIRRQVWRRDRGQCTNCGSTYAVEVDHIRPKAAGGTFSPENLRLLCRPCNQKGAIDFFGQRKMDRHLSVGR